MIYKQKILKPYYKINGKIKTLFPLRNRIGVYIIYDKNLTVKYIGMSLNDVYKAMYRHFQKWTDIQTRVTYNPFNSFVRVIYTNTDKQAESLEKGLIFKYRNTGLLDNPTILENYEADEEEKTIVREYINEKENPVPLWEGDIPF